MNKFIDNEQFVIWNNKSSTKRFSVHNYCFFLGEWGAFNEIIKRKDSSISNQVATLQMKIVTEDKAVESRTNDFFVDWEKVRLI